MERKQNKLEPSKVKKGDLMALIYWVEVLESKNKGENLVVKDLVGGMNKIGVNGADLVKNSFSADQFLEEKKVTKTQLAELLISSHNRPLTVLYEKQDGTERTMRGRLIAPEPLLGRSHVEDLELPMDEKNKMRLVDHRTLKMLTVDGVRYVLK